MVVRRFEPPYPAGGGGGDYDGTVACRAEAGASISLPPWVCTLDAGHDGDHEAGIGDNLMAAAWPRTDTEVEVSMQYPRVER